MSNRSENGGFWTQGDPGSFHPNLFERLTGLTLVGLHYNDCSIGPTIDDIGTFDENGRYHRNSMWRKNPVSRLLKRIWPIDTHVNRRFIDEKANREFRVKRIWPIDTHVNRRFIDEKANREFRAAENQARAENPEMSVSELYLATHRILDNADVR